MALPKGISREPRDIALTVRLSKRVFALLKRMAEAHSLSQADVVTHLIEQEAGQQSRLKGKSARYALNPRKR